jgi:hypothetical protein
MIPVSAHDRIVGRPSRAKGTRAIHSSALKPILGVAFMRKGEIASFAPESPSPLTVREHLMLTATALESQQCDWKSRRQTGSWHMATWVNE